MTIGSAERKQGGRRSDSQLRAGLQKCVSISKGNFFYENFPAGVRLHQQGGGSCASNSSLQWRVNGRSHIQLTYAYAYSKKLNIPLKWCNILAAPSSTHWSFDDERLFPRQVERLLVIVFWCSIVSSWLSRQHGKVSLKHVSLWSVCLRDGAFIIISLCYIALLFWKLLSSLELHAAAPTSDNDDAFCLISSAEQHHEDVKHYCHPS